MISYHPEKPDPKTPNKYWRNFKTADTDDIDRLAKGISRFVWSGCIWQDGRRLQENFLFSDWLVLDFDSPEYTLKQALHELIDCTHIIGTTKSHQIQKGPKPACDRFRVAIPWEHRITDLRNYRYNMAYIFDRFPGMDKLCKDGAHFFYPCTHIVSTETDGYRQAVRTTPPGFESPSAIKRLAKVGVVSPWAQAALRDIFPDFQRNNYCHRIAKDLYRAGFSPTETERQIINSPTYGGKPSPEVLREIQSTIKSAVKKVDKEVQ